MGAHTKTGLNISFQAPCLIVHMKRTFPMPPMFPPKRSDVLKGILHSSLLSLPLHHWIYAGALETTGQIFRYAIAHGYTVRDPASEIRPRDILMSTAPTRLR